MNTDEKIENEIQALGLTAPRVTPDRIQRLMHTISLKGHHHEGTTTTVATAFLPNGFSLATEISACASPENFNRELGLNIAMDKATASAKEHLWELEGYHLKELLEKQRELMDWADRHNLSLTANSELVEILLGDYK